MFFSDIDQPELRLSVLGRNLTRERRDVAAKEGPKISVRPRKSVSRHVESWFCGGNRERPASRLWQYPRGSKNCRGKHELEPTRSQKLVFGAERTNRAQSGSPDAKFGSGS